MKRLDEKGLTVNVDKCLIKRNKVEFFGFIFSTDGISLSQDKIKALKEATPPTTASEVSSLLGLSTYCSRFIRDHATITDPLRKLTRQKKVKGTKPNIKWTEVEQKALDALKEAATSQVLSYFDKNFKTFLVVDASPIGLGAILMQENPQDKTDIRIIAYSSRSLSEVERRYSQIEKECLAIVYGCEKFHIYLYGRSFEIDSDAKALEYIFNNTNRKIPMRIERWTWRLLPYDFKIRHVPGIMNPADYLSRHPVEDHNSHKNDVEEYVNYVFSSSIPKSITHEEIVKATSEDEILQELIRRIRGAKFNLNKRKSIMFDHVFHELSVTNENVVMRNQRIVIPLSLQDRVIAIAHEGHQGITKTKSLLRTKVWFPRLEDLVEKKIDTCSACQINHPRQYFEPLRMSEMPDGPWQCLDMDFWGPTPANSDLLIIIDEYSRYAIAEEVFSKTTSEIIPVLHKVWSMFGIPSDLKTDNGPTFTSIEFENMCKFFGIRHRLITPYWPRANGEAERFIRNLNKVMRNSAVNNTPWRKELNMFLGAYRATPHSSTGVAPANLIFKFNNISRLSSLVKFRKFDTSVDDTKAVQKDVLAKAKMKENGDKKLRVIEANFKVGDLVLYKAPKKRITSKSTPLRELEVYCIQSIKNSMITAYSTTTNHTICRNSSCFSLFKNADSNFSGLQDNLDDSFNIDVETGNNLQFIQDQVNDANQVPEQTPAQIQVNVPLQAQELNQALRRTARQNKKKVLQTNHIFYTNCFTIKIFFAFVPTNYFMIN